MTSMRGLPYRVVCAIGMNDGAFPSTTRPPEFDLMAQAPRLGDRQRRTDHDGGQEGLPTRQRRPRPY